MSFIKNISILAILIIACECAAAGTPIRECGHRKPMPLMVQIDECKTLPCELVKGSNSHMAIQFVAIKDSMNSLKANVKITTLGITVPTELEAERSNVCKNLMYGGYCPLYSGEDVTYDLVLNIVEQQPEVPVKLEVNIIDQNDKSIVSCFVTDARIKKAKKL